MDNHKKWVSEVFDRTASEYGKKSCSFFDYFGQRLVGLVKISPNQHILDVATGRGAVLFPLTQAVGSSGKIVGIDISEQMVNETTRDLRQKNIDWAELYCMDAERLNFPSNHFDFVFCGFAIFFFPSISAALTEFKRVLKPGGSLVLSTWGKGPGHWLYEATKQFANINNLAVNPVSDEKHLREILEEAHFNEIKILEETKMTSLGTLDEWWKGMWTHGTRARLEQLTPAQMNDLNQRALKRASESNQEIIEELQVFYGIAKK